MENRVRIDALATRSVRAAHHDVDFRRELGRDLLRAPILLERQQNDTLLPCTDSPEAQRYARSVDARERRRQLRRGQGEDGALECLGAALVAALPRDQVPTGAEDEAVDVPGVLDPPAARRLEQDDERLLDEIGGGGLVTQVTEAVETEPGRELHAELVLGREAVAHRRAACDRIYEIAQLGHGDILPALIPRLLHVLSAQVDAALSTAFSVTRKRERPRS